MRARTAVKTAVRGHGTCRWRARHRAGRCGRHTAGRARARRTSPSRRRARPASSLTPCGASVRTQEISLVLSCSPHNVRTQKSNEFLTGEGGISLNCKFITGLLLGLPRGLIVETIQPPTSIRWPDVLISARAEYVVFSDFEGTMMTAVISRNRKCNFHDFSTSTS